MNDTYRGLLNWHRRKEEQNGSGKRIFPSMSVYSSPSRFYPIRYLFHLDFPMFLFNMVALIPSGYTTAHFYLGPTVSLDFAALVRIFPVDHRLD
jgi:hypothetical protein